MSISRGAAKYGVRAIYGGLAGALGAACMTVIRMTARRRGVIEKTVPQAAEEWLAVRSGLSATRHPAPHHLLDQLMHAGYGAALGAAYGLTVGGRTPHAAARGVGFGLATWLLGSWIVMPLLGAKGTPARRPASENAIDLLAHLAFGLATSVVAEELGQQGNHRPSTDAVRRFSRVG
jgi:putative membrane protein